MKNSIFLISVVICLFACNGSQSKRNEPTEITKNKNIIFTTDSTSVDKSHLGVIARPIYAVFKSCICECASNTVPNKIEEQGTGFLEGCGPTSAQDGDNCELSDKSKGKMKNCDTYWTRIGLVVPRIGLSIKKAEENTLNDTLITAYSIDGNLYIDTVKQSTIQKPIEGLIGACVCNCVSNSPQNPKSEEFALPGGANCTSGDKCILSSGEKGTLKGCKVKNIPKDAIVERVKFIRN
jgi:hypothetical protein